MNIYSRAQHLLLTSLYISLTLGLIACEDDECGVIGDRCQRVCGEREVATCVTDSICACVADDQAGESAGVGGDQFAGSSGR